MQGFVASELFGDQGSVKELQVLKALAKFRGNELVESLIDGISFTSGFS